MPDLLTSCRQYVEANSRHIDAPSLIVRGAWRTQYALKLTDNDFPVLREFLLIQTDGFGSCHYDPAQGTPLLTECVGRNALTLMEYPLPYKIAALDSVATGLWPPSNREYKLTGKNSDKVENRSHIICSEAKRTAPDIPFKGGDKVRVTVVGALGSLIKTLVAESRFIVEATDCDLQVVGRNYHGVIIEDGSKTVEKVAGADVAIVTGMTLANGTINDILAVDASRRARVIMYMQTAANLVQPFLAAGITTVVSEPYPFYFMGSGESVVRVYSSV